MADVLTETVDPNDLREFEKTYHEQLRAKNVTPKASFEYAWCLVRSKYPADIRKGLVLLEELYKSQEEGQRNYLYYLAVGNARLKEYSKSLKMCQAFLSVEPNNQQILSLESTVKTKMEKEAMVGMAYAGGAVLAIGAVVGAGLAIASKVKSSQKAKEED